MRERLHQIDGLRGVAITSVALFHTFARWPDRVPYGAEYLPWTRDGWLGVPLFFVISGFAILMTIERCPTIFHFAGRRWLRLFPAMLICSLIIFATAPVLVARAAGQPTWLNLLPGVTFLQPRFLLWAGLRTSTLEGDLWSMFVEVHFYAIFATLYFLAGRLPAIAALMVAYGAAVASHVYHLGKLEGVANLLGLDWFGWFACGALFYQWTKTHKDTWLAAAFAAGILSALGTAHHVEGALQNEVRLLSLGIVVLFWAALAVPPVKAMLSSPIVLFAGAISYPFYLLHENALISMIVQEGHAFPLLPKPLLPLAPMVLVGALAWAIARFGEPWLRARLTIRFP